MARFGEPVHEADLVGALCVEAGSGDEEFPGEVHRQTPHGPQQRTGVGDEASPGLGQAELGGTGRDDQVA